MKTNLLLCAALALGSSCAWAAPLTQSTYTEIIRDVNTLATDGNPATAKVNDVLKAPARVRTGPESRAELTAPDHTITRVGANTVFSFSDSGRTLNLEQGSLLFHAPKGIGGGTIKSGGASAAVLGTTLIASATTNGGFKVIILEGKCLVTLENGRAVTLHAGQLVFITPNGSAFSSVVDINLGKLVAGSNLVNGFSHELSSASLIRAAIAGQNSEFVSGGAVDTGVAAGGLDSLDPGAYQAAVHPTLTGIQVEPLFSSMGNVSPGGRTFTTGP